MTMEPAAFRVGERLFCSMYSAGLYASEMKLTIDPLYLGAASSPETPDGWVAIPKEMLADYRDVKNAEVENFKEAFGSHCYIPGSRWQRDLADLTEELTEIDKLLSAAPKPEK